MKREEATGATTRRHVLLGGAAAALIGGTARSATPHYDILVSQTAPTGAVPTLAAALDRAASAGRPVVIALEPGVHRAKLSVAVPGVTLIGLGKGAAIAESAGAALPSPAGRNWGTGGSTILTIAAPDVTLRNLTIRNDHPYLAQPMQAVALAVAAGAPRTRIESCRIESYQDTLLLQASTYLRDCTISGCVDFIFGGGAAFHDRCTIVSRYVSEHSGGYVAAPSTPEVQAAGLVFDRCRLLREPGVADDSVFLGRPWRAGGNMALLGAASFVNCFMAAHIRRDGWSAMGFRDPEGVQRMLEPEVARLFEYGSTGPGAGSRGPKRRMLDAATAARLTPAAVLGWRPDMITQQRG